ncbi:hypothetical protein [Streptomyces lancefieldiae]|uniref:Uncharacterized protein n=1 Tax=Streptomyces lancefieldiae TaxID=3075520 RepID=A0ABU3AQW9_9ACTN|nr:hypothetical protein [Streptomyces sp. DSM 40712]MDT0612595.1 hypothetical protein [Streptomyces sp. DSM 40712]
MPDDSQAEAGVVILGTCADEGTERGDDVRHALTARGELLPRRQKQLALAAATGAPDADIVVEVHDGFEDRRRRTDPVPTTEGSVTIAGTGAPDARSVELPGD